MEEALTMSVESEFQQLTMRLEKKLNNELFGKIRLIILKLCPLVDKLLLNTKKSLGFKSTKPLIIL